MQGLSSQNSDDAHSSLLANPTAYNLNMKVPSSFHMSVTIYQTTECHIPEDFMLKTTLYVVTLYQILNPTF